MPITTRTTTGETGELCRGPNTSALTVRPVGHSVSVCAWAEYAEHCASASLFHHPLWCGAVEASFGHRPRHLVALRGDQAVGVLPLMEVDSFVGGRMLVSVPYGTYGGVLSDDDETCAALAAAAAELARQREATVLDLRSAQARVSSFESVPGYLGFVRDLPLHPNDVPAFVPKRARAAARHAQERDGVTVRHDTALTHLAWQLYCRSMRRIASLNYPYRFFTVLAERLGERFWTSVAFCGDRPVAGTISFVFRDTVMPYILGLDERIRCDGAANLLYLSVMERAVRSGLRRFDYGRSRMDNVGAVGFKKNQGFEPQPLGYQRYVPPGRQPPDLKPSNPRFALARRVWRRLPLAVARPLGAWLARSIPG